MIHTCTKKCHGFSTKPAVLLTQQINVDHGLFADVPTCGPRAVCRCANFVAGSGAVTAPPGTPGFP